MPVTAADLALSDQIRAEQETRSAPKKRNGKIVAVYVCPTPGCPDYYGASNMPALELQMNLRSDLTHTTSYDPSKALEDTTHNRAECPTCRIGGKKVDRIRVELFVPAEALTVADAA
jgi:hypothetical protein